MPDDIPTVSSILFYFKDMVDLVCFVVDITCIPAGCDHILGRHVLPAYHENVPVGHGSDVMMLPVFGKPVFPYDIPIPGDLLKTSYGLLEMRGSQECAVLQQICGYSGFVIINPSMDYFSVIVQQMCVP